MPSTPTASRSCLRNPKRNFKSVTNYSHSLQLVAVGTLQNLQYWECKKGEMILDTKSDNQSKEISRVVVSGNAQKYSMFFAAGQSIRGVTKKGKEFFKLDTSHTEAIKSLHVHA